MIKTIQPIERTVQQRGNIKVIAKIAIEILGFKFDVKNDNFIIHLRDFEVLENEALKIIADNKFTIPELEFNTFLGTVGAISSKEDFKTKLYTLLLADYNTNCPYGLIINNWIKI